MFCVVLVLTRFKSWETTTLSFIFFFVSYNFVSVLEGSLCWTRSASAQIFAPVVVFQQQVFATTNDGVLLVLSVLTGNPLISIDIGVGSLSPRGIQVKERTSHEKLNAPGSTCVCILCSTSGSLMTLEINCANPLPCTILGSTRLNTEVFSGLISFGDLIFYGARDESVNCIKIGALAG